MALGKCHTVALEGVIAHPVAVEAYLGAGLPGIQVVGLADTAISESRDRIRTAVANSQLAWPKTKIVVSMSPASLPKSGSHFDLPMALAVLCAGLAREKGLLSPVGGGFDTFQGEHPCAQLSDALVLGELGLDGSVKPVAGIIPALLTARAAGYDTIVIPPGNAQEATLVSDMRVLVAPTLQDAFAWACGHRKLPPVSSVSAPTALPTQRSDLDFADIAGQHHAKWAAEVAAAGGHHLLMIGPPGSGKSMIAARLPSILPTLDTDKSVEATAIHSIAGKPGQVVDQAPFIAPHASVTRAALLGGGSGNPRPGAVSLAHHGVLFLDEVSEVPATILDGLRAPLEEGQVRLARARREVAYPARFQLVMAANPCRCAAEDPSQCRCKATARQNYLSNLSGPLRDRLDMIVELKGQSAALHAADEEPSIAIAQRVQVARERAQERWAKAGLEASHNGEVSGAYLRRHRPASEDSMLMLGAYLAQGELSQRGVDRVLRMAWTLADLAGAEQPDLEHVGQALELRGGAGLERLAA